MPKRGRAQMDEESDSDSEIDIIQFVQSFSFLIRVWAVKYNISHMALTALLKLLREEGHVQLPKDSRTLLETPKTVKVTNIGNGKYWYRSLKDKLAEICKTKKCPSKLELSIHIDGMPPYRSSRLEFWPIQFKIKGVEMKNVFLGLYLGRSKPASVELFLRPLLNDLKELLKNGLTVKIGNKMRNFTVALNKMILDAPARAFLKCIKGHSGYFSCERCTEEGTYVYTNGDVKKDLKDIKKKAVRKNIKMPTLNINKKKKKQAKQNVNRGHVCLIGTDADLRTDETFRDQQQEDHHTGKSPLEELPIDMIGFFPVEYLHLLLVGVMKKLLLLWVNGHQNFKAKFSALDIKQISEKLIRAGKTKPSEINRTCRGLCCLSNWKATEFRTFLLKTGPAILREHLPEEVYNHFLALHCATMICCNESLLPYINVAKYLYKEFVDNFGEIYGYQNYCYNVHSCVHIHIDVERFGILDNFSAFDGESNLASIKRMLRGGYKPLQQIVNRIFEMESVERYQARAQAEVPEKIGLHKNILHLKNLRLDSSERNRWILTKNNRIFKVKGFSQINNKIRIHGAILNEKKQRDLFEMPIKSSNLSVYVSELKEKADLTITLDDIHCKLFKIEVSSNESAFFPLPHFTQ